VVKVKLFHPCATFREAALKRFGVHLAFVATRSGLLRFSDHSDLFEDPNDSEEHDHDDVKEP
jgi:hypothetical protein